MDKVFIGSDHRGYILKTNLIQNGIADFCDLGCYTESMSHYPDIVVAMSSRIGNNFGILICDTGIGMSIAGNSCSNLFAALCFNQDMAKMAREHNNANVLVLPAKYLNTSQAIELIRVFCNTKFREEERHVQRIEKIRLIRKQG